MFERRELDLDAFHHAAQTGPCFICRILAQDPDYPAHIVFSDEQGIAFLDRHPLFYGHTLVAPRKHIEQVSGDATLDEYLALQRRVYRVAEAVRLEVGAERVYLLSLGSQQGNRHVHWHVIPLSPGVPYREQQLAALRQAPLDLSEDERVALARRIRRRLQARE